MLRTILHKEVIEKNELEKTTKKYFTGILRAIIHKQGLEKIN